MSKLNDEYPCGFAAVIELSIKNDERLMWTKKALNETLNKTCQGYNIDYIGENLESIQFGGDCRNFPVELLVFLYHSGFDVDASYFDHIKGEAGFYNNGNYVNATGLTRENWRNMNPLILEYVKNCIKECGW